MNNKSKKIIIVGGVAGGASCAARLRRHNEGNEIILLERGEHVSFANCGLPYFISGVIEKEESLFLADVELFRQRFRVDARVFSEAVNIDPNNKTVTILNHESGDTYSESYDELVLSPGAKPIRPPLPGIDQKGIFSLRNVPDSLYIKAWIAENNVKSAVVVGGGFIGLEMLENMIHLGIETTLIERDDQILPPLDKEMTLPIVNELEKHGAKILTGVSVNGFPAQQSGLCVETSSGELIQTDMVILSIGVTPENELAKLAGLDIGPQGHIVVDKNLRSSNRNIFAIGDCAQVRHIISGKKTALALAGPANRQGRIAADVIAGRGRMFRGVQGTSICGLFDITAASTGLNEKTLIQESIEYSAIYAYPANHVGYYPGATTIFTKLLFSKDDGRVLGAQAVGEAGIDRRIDVIAMAIQMKATVFDLEEAELCYAPQFGAAKDPVNIMGMIGSNEMRGDIHISHWNQIGESDSIVLDVRTEKEVATKPMPNVTINIPLDDIRSRLHELPKRKSIHVSCAVGLRAYNAVRLLQNLGYECSLLSGGEQTYAYLLNDGDKAPKPECQQIAAAEEAVNATTEVASETDDSSLASLYLSEPQAQTQSSPSVQQFKPQENELHLHDDEVLDLQTSWEVMHSQLIAETLSVTDKLSMLAQPRIFSNLPEKNISDIFERMELMPVTTGQTIINQGEDGDFFYIILEGTASVWQQGIYDTELKCMCELGKGSHFGDEALVTEMKRGATIKMVTDGALLRVSRDNFNEFITKATLKQIDIPTAQMLIDDGCEILDVRYEEEYEEFHLPNSKLIPLADLRDRLCELEQSKNYIIVCHSGMRSAIATMILRQHNYKGIGVREGLRDWPMTDTFELAS